MWKCGSPGNPATLQGLTAEAVAEAVLGKINCIVAGGGDGTINEVFATAHVAGLPDGCSLGIIPLGTANDFAHSAGVPTGDIAAALQIAASARSQWIDERQVIRKSRVRRIWFAR